MDISDKVAWLHRNGGDASFMRMSDVYYSGWLSKGGIEFSGVGSSPNNAYANLFDNIKHELLGRCHV